MTNPDRDLLAYLLDDEPVPDDVRADPRFAEAENDVRAIKRGLHLLAASTPKKQHAQRGRWNGNVVLAVAACTLAAVALGGLVAAPSLFEGTEQQSGSAGSGSVPESTGGEQGAPRNPAPSPRAPGGDLTEEGLVSCATLVVDGVITDVQPGPTTETNTLTLNVTRSYKPASTASQVTVTAYRSDEQRVGARAFVIVSRFPQEPTAVFVGERESTLQRFEEALAEKSLPPCPGPG